MRERTAGRAAAGARAAAARSPRRVHMEVCGGSLFGDGATALTKIRAVGNDFSLDPGIGNCGKAGQWVPVGVGQPTLFISGLTIGGSDPK